MAGAYHGIEWGAKMKKQSRKYWKGKLNTIAWVLRTLEENQEWIQQEPYRLFEERLRELNGKPLRQPSTPQA
jgi:hypothetical protein